MSSTQRIVSADSIAESGTVEYLALTYFQPGDADTQPPGLTAQNEEDWSRHVPFEDLPLLFRQTITLTRRLGFNYLWIDILCTQPPSASPSADRTTAFTNAHCTISAPGPPNTHSPLFTHRAPTFPHFACALRSSRTRTLVVLPSSQYYTSHAFAQDVDEAPLYHTSAAARCDRLASRRVLHFGARFVFFECATHVASETEPGGVEWREKRRRTLVARVLRRAEEETRLSGKAFVSLFNPVDGLAAHVRTVASNTSSHTSAAEQEC